MILALLPVLFFHAAQVQKRPVPSTTFTQILHQADVARTSDRLPDAIQLYRQAVKLRPSWSEGWWWLGSIFYEEDRFPEARDAFAHFISTAPKDAAPAYAFLGLCEYEMRDYDAASKHLRTWVTLGSPGNSQLIDVASFHWALLLTRSGHFFEALYLLGKKVQRHGPDSQLEEAMGLAWLRMPFVPEDYPPEKREMVWLAGAASAYLSALKLDRVHEYLDQLARLYGQERNVHFLRGYVYEFEKRDDEASDEYGQELKVSPDNVDAMIQLALICVEDSRLDEARPLATRAVALQPKSPLAHYALGRLLFANEKWAQCARELELARQMAPNNFRVHFDLARAYQKLGRMADADRENAAFEKLKNKEEVLALPNRSENQQAAPQNTGRRK
ncbi:MAG: tetratricopeptide repeat protein [Candidatus Acidiferrum sp.]